MSDLSCVYSDASFTGKLASVAWFIGPLNFGVETMLATNSNHGELLAALLAVTKCDEAVELVTDSMFVVDIATLPRTADRWVRKARQFPEVAIFRDLVDARAIETTWAPGHGYLTPPGLSFCDDLARQTARQVSRG